MDKQLSNLYKVLKNTKNLTDLDLRFISPSLTVLKYYNETAKVKIEITKLKNSKYYKVFRSYHRRGDVNYIGYLTAPLSRKKLYNSLNHRL